MTTTEFLTVQDVASILQVNEVTVRRWLKSGKLEGVRAGSRLWRIHRSQLDELLKDSEV